MLEGEPRHIKIVMHTKDASTPFESVNDGDGRAVYTTQGHIDGFHYTHGKSQNMISGIGSVGDDDMMSVASGLQCFMDIGGGLRPGLERIDVRSGKRHIVVGGGIRCSGERDNTVAGGRITAASNGISGGQADVVDAGFGHVQIRGLVGTEHRPIATWRIDFPRPAIRCVERLIGELNARRYRATERCGGKGRLHAGGGINSNIVRQGDRMRSPRPIGYGDRDGINTLAGVVK